MTAIYVVTRIVVFTGGSIITVPLSFHKTEKEAADMKDAALAELRKWFAVNGTKALLARIGIESVGFEVGAYETPEADLIRVPRLIMPPS